MLHSAYMRASRRFQREAMVQRSDRTGGGRIRVGAVTYLNARPLVFSLARFAPQVEIVVDLPSRLADLLAAGQLDVAMIPSIEFARHSGYAIISDACIACNGAVRSVKLYSRVPIERLRTLALDEARGPAPRWCGFCLGSDLESGPTAGRCRSAPRQTICRPTR